MERCGESQHIILTHSPPLKQFLVFVLFSFCSFVITVSFLPYFYVFFADSFLLPFLIELVVQLVLLFINCEKCFHTPTSSFSLSKLYFAKFTFP